MVKVSVVIPVYNAEKHIEKTINSLLTQTFKDIEFIFINDGSKDNSLKILREYEKKDKRIIVIDQENFGPGGARNTGILKSKGEYIGFLDSDDTQDKRMYELLYNKAIQDDFDMVMCNTVSIYPDKIVNVDAGITNDCYTDEDIKKCMIFSYAVVWNKLIKSDIVKQTLFSKNLWYEDVEFLFKLYPKIKKIGYVNEYLCNYIQTDNSITYTFNNKIYDLHTVMNNIVNYYKENSLFDEYLPEIEYSYVRYMYGTFIRRIAKTKDKKEYKKAFKFAIKEVNDKFPNYKKNKYLNMSGGKNFYLKKFNNLISKVIYVFEKKEMKYELQNKVDKLLKK